MRELPSTFGSAVSINLKFLMACLFGWAAWYIWPTTPEWYGLGIASILLGLGAVAHVINALQLMGRVYKREKELCAYMALGGEPKSSEMASDAKLKDAGML
jgi:hypothetical protein